MGPIYWADSNGPMPQRMPAPGSEGTDAAEAAPLAGVHLAAEVRFEGGAPSNAVAVGVDAVDVRRLAGALERTPAMRERCFTPTELVDAATGGDEVGHLGICFAAKEAVAKALGCGLGPVGFHDIELVRGPSGAPTLALGGAATPLAEAAGIAGWLVSATHTATVAQTVVIALDSRP
ncbi:MAG: holo-ACP synthase [Microthrixaceae bacterium]